VLSHRSAAALWGIRPISAVRVEVTVPRESGYRSNSSIVVHRPLRPAAATLHDAIPVTTPAQTLIDLSSVLSPPALEQALEVAERLRLLDAGKLPPHLAKLAGAFDPRLRSPLEAQLLALCRARGLPPPRVNAVVGGFEVDFSWPDQRLVIEADGHRYHGTRAAFERDRERDALLTALGWRVVRITHRRLAERSPEVGDLLERLLSVRSPWPATPG
jgi:very-short-patch-repair endonuclease